MEALPLSEVRLIAAQDWIASLENRRLKFRIDV
jgi:hypothetical protein